MAFGFMGEYYHNLDQKNRLAVPAKIRAGLGTNFVICKPLNPELKCLFLYTKDEWDALLASVTEGLEGVEVTKVTHRFYRSANEVETDAQGRFTVPSSYIAYAGIEKEVCIFGSGKRVELWNPETFSAADDSEDTFDYTKVPY